jgi:hypothetical protein
VFVFTAESCKSSGNYLTSEEFRLEYKRLVTKGRPRVAPSATLESLIYPVTVLILCSITHKITELERATMIHELILISNLNIQFKIF